MKGKLLSGFLATVMALTLPMTALASNEVNDFTSSTDVTGQGTVLAVSDILDVIVPTNANFALNPQMLSGQPQVMSGSFGVINHGSTPIKVAIEASVSGSSVTMSDADTIAAINNATSASSVSDEKLVYLAVAPVLSGASVTATTVTGPSAYAGVSFDTVADVASGSAVAIPADAPASIGFKLDKASYNAALSGAAVTTGGGFDTTGVTAVQDYTGDYTNDPVAAFTLIGSVNKYADWTGVTPPTANLRFTFTKLNGLEYDELEVDPDTKNMLVGEDASSDFYVVETASYDIWVAIQANENDGGLTASKISNVKINGRACQYTVDANFIFITAAQLTAAGLDDNDPSFVVSFTHDGVNYSKVYTWGEPDSLSSSSAYIWEESNYDIWVNIANDSGTGRIANASDISDVKLNGRSCAYTYDSGWIFITASQLTAAGLDDNAASFTITFTYSGTNYSCTYTWGSSPV